VFGKKTLINYLKGKIIIRIPNISPMNLIAGTGLGPVTFGL